MDSNGESFPTPELNGEMFLRSVVDTDRQTDRQTDIDRQRQTDRQRQAGKQRQTDRQNSELYYTRIKILGSCLFLQSVPANLHANRLHIKQQ